MPKKMDEEPGARGVRLVKDHQDQYSFCRCCDDGGQELEVGRPVPGRVHPHYRLSRPSTQDHRRPRVAPAVHRAAIRCKAAWQVRVTDVVATDNGPCEQESSPRAVMGRQPCCQ
jgi:hypothetical protein